MYGLSFRSKASVSACSEGAVPENKRVCKLRRLHIFCRNYGSRESFEIKSEPTRFRPEAAAPASYRCFCEYRPQ
jgi:hypothetical protein